MLYPPRVIDVGSIAAFVLKNGCTVYIRDREGSRRLYEEMAVRCHYDRPPIENVRMYSEDCIPENGDVIIDLEGRGTMIPEDGHLLVSLDEDEAHAVAEIVERSIYGRIAVFFDRDDTINDDVGHCRRPEDIHIYPYVGDALKRLNDAGILTLMVTNQSVIGRGWLDGEGLERIHEKVRTDVLPGRIDDIFYCPHLPDAGCACRKPAIGMALQALERYNIDTLNSYMIGDSDRDIMFGEAIGCTSFKVDGEFTFADAVDEILSGTQKKVI